MVNENNSKTLDEISRDVNLFTAEHARKIVDQYNKDPLQYIGDKGKQQVEKIVAQIRNASIVGSNKCTCDLSDWSHESRKIFADYLKSRKFKVKFKIFRSEIMDVEW